jgi:hypothetical protein
MQQRSEPAMDIKEMEDTDKPVSKPKEVKPSWVRFELFGIEMVEKEVRASGNSGRIYLPPDWIGCKVKIVKID